MSFTSESFKPLVFTLCAATCYILPSLSKYLIPMLPLYFFFILKIAGQDKLSTVFFSGLLIGFLVSAVHLRFFYNIFFAGAIGLWLILGIWTAFLTLGISIAAGRLNRWGAIIFISSFYFILEYISCELYPLKFTWNTPGYLFHDSSLRSAFQIFGIYGFSTIILTLVSIAFSSSHCNRILLATSLSLLAFSFFNIKPIAADSGPLITGIQLEFPNETEAFNQLDKAIAKHPETDIFMLSEYTFTEGIPKKAEVWCRDNQKFLIFGAIITKASHKENTAVVINPNGEISHTQIKAVPIQFFNDGIPAKEQKLWESPWGNIGICICYDLSYTRVIDRLIDQGAGALIVPTMDVIDWGKHQHFLHSRVAPVRAAEYGIAIFKTASSGISQSVTKNGYISKTAPFPGQGKIITDQLKVKKRKSSKPADRFLFYPALGALLTFICFSFLRRRKINAPATSSQLF